ncbi:MAG: AAA family ATPase [Alphaproteobacteria bacterium]|nr:AAA family ATPase [Alphaproteobacteria bacterium]
MERELAVIGVREPAETRLSRAGEWAVPVWFDELNSGLSTRPHFAISGNLRDLYPLDDGTEVAFLSFEQILWRIAREQKYGALFFYDPDGGLRLHNECDDHAVSAVADRGLELGQKAATPAEFAELHRSITTLNAFPIVFVIDYASHLFETLPHGFSEVLVEADRAARQMMIAAGRQGEASMLLSPTLWLVDKPGDLPEWFVVGNDALREVSVELPNLEDRYAFAKILIADFADGAQLEDAKKATFLEQFALESDGMTLVGMKSVARLAENEGLACSEISEAIRTYRLGTRRNPWTSPVMRSRILRAEEILTNRIKGQGKAIEKTLEILVRSIVGLSGSQTSSRYSRPRGVLFFAGPTGVGKTELAKAVTELLFGDDTACQRFDMSEFMEENSINRLIGAPPGHPGHERGGELVNAMHKRPFSVLLFDEVEKAHPRILDTFLQILDDGRLTDSRGSTAYFSEALIIFTSNIGMIGKDHSQNMGMNILPSDHYDEIDRKIVDAVHGYFRYELGRPELMNRIGQNIVTFDFMRGETAWEIFSAIMGRVLEAVRAEHGVDIEITPDALRDLRRLCVSDWFEGGRGIGNRIESHFINPLSRELFNRRPEHRMFVRSVHEVEGKTQLDCS